MRNAISPTLAILCVAATFALAGAGHDRTLGADELALVRGGANSCILLDQPACTSAGTSCNNLCTSIWIFGQDPIWTCPGEGGQYTMAKQPTYNTCVYGQASGRKTCTTSTLYCSSQISCSGCVNFVFGGKTCGLSSTDVNPVGNATLGPDSCVGST